MGRGRWRGGQREGGDGGNGKGRWGGGNEGGDGEVGKGEGQKKGQEEGGISHMKCFGGHMECLGGTRLQIFLDFVYPCNAGYPS